MPGAQRPGRVVGAVAGVPHLAPLCLVGGPAEPLPAVLGGDLLGLLGLRGDLGRRAVELEEQRRGDGVVEVAVAVDRLDEHLVEQLDARDGDRVLGDREDAADRVAQRRERTDGGRHRLGRGLDAQGDLADQPERALRADEQPRQVVAGRRLARPRARAQDLAIGADDDEREHVLAHRAVANGRRARRAGGDHAAERRVSAGVDREEDALGAQRLVELAARDARFHADVEVVDGQAKDAVHLAHVDADPPVQRLDVALERAAGAEGDDRRLVTGAHADDRGRLLGARREDDGVGRRDGVKRLVGAVLLADVVAGEDAVGAEKRAQVVEHAGRLGLGQAALGRGGDARHVRMGPHRAR